MREFGTAFEYEIPANSFSIFGFISGVKVDLIHYHHPLIEKPISFDGIRLISIQDIAAMKMNAILGGGQKKDFFDMDVLIEKFSLQEIFGFYSYKYPNQMLAVSLPQALVYFEDAEESENPISLNSRTWGMVKSHLREKVRGFLC